MNGVRKLGAYGSMTVLYYKPFVRSTHLTLGKETTPYLNFIPVPAHPYCYTATLLLTTTYFSCYYLPLPPYSYLLGLTTTLLLTISYYL